MRSGKLIIVLGLVLLVGCALIFVGCGDDDESPTNSIGSLTDPEFMAVQDQVDQFVDSTLVFVLNGFGTITSISGGDVVDPIYYGPAFPDTNTFSSDYINGWNIVTISLSGGGYSFGVIDSVKFFENDQASMTGGSADSLFYRHKWQFEVADTVSSFADFEGYSGFDYRNLQSNIATIDGSHYLNIESKQVTLDSTVWRNFYFSSDVTDLTINKTASGWAQSCPTSGTITATVEVAYQKDDNVQVDASWDISIVFTDGSMAVSAQNGNTVWSYTADICTPVEYGI